MQGEQVATQPTAHGLLPILRQCRQLVLMNLGKDDISEGEHLDRAVEGGLSPAGALGDRADLAGEPRKESHHLRALRIVDGADTDGPVLGQHGYSSGTFRMVMRLMRRGSAEAIVNFRFL